MKYLLYFNAFLFPFDGKILLVGGKYNKRIVATQLIQEIVRICSVASDECEIISYLSSQFDVSKSSLKELLDKLSNRGFLVKDTVRIPNFACVDDDSHSHEISHLAIVTCDRPRALKASTLGYIKNAQAHSYDLHYLVSDDSFSSRQQNIDVLSEISKELKCNILFFGSSERESLVRKLAKMCDMPQYVLAFGLYPKALNLFDGNIFSAGASRNCAIAVSQCRNLLVIDDDSLPIGNYSSMDRQLSFSQGAPNYQHEDYVSQPLEYDNREIDIVGLNNIYLGKTLGSILSSSSSICVEKFFNNTPLILSEGSHWLKTRIAFTTNSIQGVEDVSVDTLLNQKSLNRGWYVEKGDSDCVCTNPFLLTTTATGIANDVFRIPFVPVFRNEDVMTGYFFNSLFPNSLGVRLNTNLYHNKVGGYTSILQSTSDFYQEVLYPYLLQRIIRITNSSSNLVIDFRRRLQLLVSSIKTVCGDNAKQMIYNISDVDPHFSYDISTLLELSKVQKSNYTESNQYPYMKTIPNSYLELVSNSRIALFREVLLQYCNLLSNWHIILDACLSIDSLPASHFEKGRFYCYKG